jgi:hypothetical protein
MDNQEENSSASPEPAAAPAADDKRVIPTDERTGTLIFAVVLTLFGIFWVWASSDLPSRQQTAYLSQGFLPITAGFLLAGLSALLFLSTWFTKARPAAELGREPLFRPRAEMLAAAVFAALLAYILILPHVHYAISTFLLMAVGLGLSGEPIRPRLFLIAAAMTALFYAIFIYGLQLALPGSIFG